ncbi:response regulator [Urbifossiella limnaea]|uniref:Response regulator MprA n=1 Tax=Urbifossiella limnaea TaxID=2528023 RepID=A0A517XZG2_9BACT|nr:response regulator [Urbifossiella limnaea]QDU22901.1 Response regulator MprA [Urbifossiella limnaea]
MPTPPTSAEPPAVTYTSPSAVRRAHLPVLHLRVLVVDDNRDAADSLAGLLRLCGAEVCVCYDGRAAVAEFDEFRPDAGLFDVNMPRMDGCELAERLRERGGDRPLFLVAITAIDGPEEAMREARAGFDLHLTKPADPVRVVEALAAFS